MPPYNFEKDPYYAELFSNPSSANNVLNSFNNYEKYQQNQLNNELTQERVSSNKRKKKIEDSVGESMRSGKTVSREDIYTQIKNEALQEGDVDTYLKTTEIQEEQTKQEEARDWAQVERLKKLDPHLAFTYYSTHLAPKYGLRDVGDFMPKPKIRVVDGVVFDENSLTPGQRVGSGKSSGGGKGRAPTEVYDKETGQSAWVDLSSLSGSERNRFTKQKPMTEGEKAIDRMMAEMVQGGSPPPPPSSDLSLAPPRVKKTVVVPQGVEVQRNILRKRGY